MSAPRPRFILRTCQPDGTSRNGFRWPLVVGEVAVAPDWNDRRLWWDVASSCYRRNFAEVGDGGLKPNTPYRLDSDTHEFVEVEA